MGRTATIRVGVLLCLSLLVGCTKSTAGQAGGSTTSAANGASTTTAPAGADTCRPPEDTSPVDVTAVGSLDRDYDMASFDGTRIRLHWFPHPRATESEPVPTVLMGPGWSLPGATDIDQASVLGSIDIRSLRDAGYNVLTWDPRGFGASGGEAMIDAASHEGRDVQQIIDWIATLPVARLDASGDPRIGMTGGSYGGGIQLVAAAIDCRVDAIVPIVAWHSLKSSLFKNDTVKIGWANVLADAATTSSVDPHINSARESALSTGTLSDEDRKWFIDRGPGDLVKKIKAPTLLIHGTIDTLFTLDEAVENYRILKENKVPVAMLWNCDGHGICLSDPGDPTRASRAAIAWLDRYLKEVDGAEPTSFFDTIDQNGKRFIADSFQPEPTDYVRATGSGSLDLLAEGGAGPVDPTTVSGQILSGIAADLTPARALNAVEVDVSSNEETLVLGAPRLKLTYKGSLTVGEAPERPTRVFAQLIDSSTGLVIGNQITPIKVELDGKEHSVEVPLEMISFSMAHGAKVTLQVVATTVAYLQPALGGTIDFSEIAIGLPLAGWLRPAD